MLKTIAICLVLSSSLYVSTADARDSASAINDGPFMHLVGGVEGPDGYDSVTGYARIKPPKKISKMTIGEVLDYQRTLRAAGSKSSAVGRFQFIYTTLSSLVQEYNIRESARFNAAMQDYLARRLMNDCSFYERSINNHALGDCLARVWAALPVMTGKNKGRSYYRNVAGNRALVTRDQVLDVLKVRFHVPKAPRRTLLPISYPDDGRMADPVPLQTTTIATR